MQDERPHSDHLGRGRDISPQPRPAPDEERQPVGEAEEAREPQARPLVDERSDRETGDQAVNA